MPRVDNPDIPQPAREEFEYITVPDTDLFDQPHPAIGINGVQYGPGRHKISDPVLAQTIKERLKAYERSNVRILQPKRDSEAERLASNSGRGQVWTGQS